jgi:glutamyl-tRNA synthetase
MDELPRGGLTRIAPTPSGYLHAGNALNFLLTAQLAEALGARLMLRIDDLDAARMRPEYVEDIFRTLDWLGIRCDLGPSGPEDLNEQWSQRHRLHLYDAMLHRLCATGLLYACDHSRTEVRGLSAAGIYPGVCRDRALPLGTPGAAWRLRTDAAGAVSMPGMRRMSGPFGLEAGMGDPVVRQRDGAPAYQVASLADDEHFGTTLIVRGEDLLLSSACQWYMAGKLGLERFPKARFVHHLLMTGEHGAKLSKSAGALSVKAMREAGGTPDALRRRADGLVEAILRGEA